MSGQKKDLKCMINCHRGTKKGTKDSKIGFNGRKKKGIKGKENNFRNRKEGEGPQCQTGDLL